MSKGIEASEGMSDDLQNSVVDPEVYEPPSGELAPAAQRALAEAEARRAKPELRIPTELNGRGGLDPARYGDWEVKGLASDF
jgi:hypothetical protein